MSKALKPQKTTHIVLKKIHSGFNSILFFMNSIVAVMLIFVYLAPYCNPKFFYILSILALGYPYLLSLNIGFALWWLYRQKRKFYLSLVVLLIGSGHLLNFVGLQFINRTKLSKEGISVMSYNVRYFDAPFHKDESFLLKEQDQILRNIKTSPADIFCGQEFSGRSGFYNKRAQTFFKKNLKMPYSYAAGKSSLAIFSKYPILNKGVLEFKNSFNGAIFVDVLYKKQRVRVYNLHLQSVRLGSDEDEVLKTENLQSLNAPKTKQKYRRIGQKLKKAFVSRSVQADFIAQHIEESPYPVILCGDFNDTPISYTYHCIAQKLNDCFRAKGAGLGSTYAGNLPFLRIDYIFTSKDFMVQDFKKITLNGSDHYPVWSHLYLNSTKK